jgi:hypothetical protein
LQRSQTKSPDDGKSSGLFASSPDLAARFRFAGPGRQTRPQPTPAAANSVNPASVPAARWFFFSLYMSCIMSLMISGIITLINTGMSNGFLSRWIGAWLVAWAIAFPLVIFIAPLAGKMADTTVARLSGPK